MLIRITDKIDLNEVYACLPTPEAGGIALFIGTVRNRARGKEVTRLVFEAYEPMALKEMHRIANESMIRWPLEQIVMIHATGEKRVGEPVVVTAASSAHRDAAFAACRYLIDELKRSVPVWKHEFYTDHSTWIAGHP